MGILITGSKGQLGSDAVKVLGRFHETMVVDLEELDITNPEDVEAMVRDFRPDVILNCAAFTNVDACETQRDIAWKVNVEGPRNLALSVKKKGRASYSHFYGLCFQRKKTTSGGLSGGRRAGTDFILRQNQA